MKTLLAALVAVVFCCPAIADDRAYLIEVGRIKMSGTAGDLAASDEIRKAYMGL